MPRQTPKIDWKDKEAVKRYQAEYYKTYHEKNREKINAYQKAYRSEMPKEKKREYSRQYVEKNRDKINRYDKERRANMTDDQKEANKVWHKIYAMENPDKKKEAARKWRETNGKDYNRIYAAKNRAKINEQAKIRRQNKKNQTNE